MLKFRNSKFEFEIELPFPLLRGVGTTVLAAAMTTCAMADQQRAATGRLTELVNEAWEFELREDPLFATSVGDHRFDDRLPAVGEKDETRRAGARRALLERLQAIDRAALNDQERITYDVLAVDLRDRLGEYEFGAYRIPFTSDDGFHISYARIPATMPFRTSREYDNYLARLRAWPNYVQQHIALLREAVRAGFTMPRIVLEGLEVTIASHVIEDPERSIFWSPFANLPASIAAAEQERLRAAGRAAIKEAVVPGYRTLHQFFTGDYMPAARTTVGASELPRGREFYAHRVRLYTTLGLSPTDVHRL